MGFVTKFASQQLPSWMPPPIPGLGVAAVPGMTSLFPGAADLGKKIRSVIPGAEAVEHGDRSLLPGTGLAKGLFGDVGRAIGRDD